MPKSTTPASIDAYISAADAEYRPILEKIRQTIRKAAPHAEETISYGMPAFRQGRILIYFAAFKKHIGLFPPVRGDAKLIQEAAAFAGPKGNLRFPLGRRIPYGLIGHIVKSRLKSAPPGSGRRIRHQP